MCENEARVLGDGILRMNMDYFPDKMLAETATEKLKEGLEDGEEDEKKEGKMKEKVREKMKNIETTRYGILNVRDIGNTAVSLSSWGWISPTCSFLNPPQSHLRRVLPSLHNQEFLWVLQFLLR
jgi:hypothetical protein